MLTSYIINTDKKKEWKRTHKEENFDSSRTKDNDFYVNIIL